MNRRTFIRRSALAAFATGVYPHVWLPGTEEVVITILHTNDVHSRIEPFPATHARYPGRGGFARRATLVKNIRRENPNTLLFDAGDVFQGTPYFNYFGGELEFRLMSDMGYDAITIGNHDFDNGIDGLYRAYTRRGKFAMLSANYDFSNTVLDGLVKPYEIFEKQGIRIGVFGLGIELEGLVDKKMSKETRYLDPVEIAADMTRLLKHEKKCDLVIAVTHLGYHYKNKDKISDLKLARLTRDIDLIIGGHTHTFLKKPTVTKNADGKNVLINQVGWAGLNLGRVDFVFSKGKNVSNTVNILV